MMTMIRKDGGLLEVRGLSSDTKPTEGIPNGSSFLEIDTSTMYFFDAAAGTWLAWG